jgi:hypothetical protein
VADTEHVEEDESSARCCCDEVQLSVVQRTQQELEVPEPSELDVALPPAPSKLAIWHEEELEQRMHETAADVVIFPVLVVLVTSLSLCSTI